MTDNVGVTPSERYLGRLCRRSFLSLWSFQNLFTDEGKKSSNAAGHELCDLLVVFGHDVIVFSDKNITFNRNKTIEVAWRRWYRKSVEKSARQLHGAEAWIKRYPGRIYLEPRCVNPFPITFPNSDLLRFHLVAVATGAYEACLDFFGGRSIGSLTISTNIVGLEHESMPFTIGRVDATRRFVHVFDESSLDAVFSEIDTIADFTAYLKKRETFLTSQPIIWAPGEEQILAIYLTKMNAQNEHDFLLPSSNDQIVVLGEGFWEDMVKSPQYRAKKEADKISYGWDELIEHFAKYGGGYNGNHDRSEAYVDIEIGLRHMAAEPRLRRRQLASALTNLLENTPQGKRMARVVHSNDFPERAYVFLILPYDPSQPYDEYHQHRVALLCAYCQVAKLRCNEASFIIGIATENYAQGPFQEDLVALDVRVWTDDLAEETRILQQEGSLLLNDNVTTSEGHTLEYPEGKQFEMILPKDDKPIQHYREKRRKRMKMQKSSRRKNRR